MKLNDNDYKILELLRDKGEVHQKDIKKYFSAKIDALEYRLELLSEPTNFFKDSTSSFPDSKSSYILQRYEGDPGVYGTCSTPTGFYSITDKGSKALQDYLVIQSNEQSKRRLDLILRWLPIIISMIALAKSFDKEIISIWKQLVQ